MGRFSLHNGLVEKIFISARKIFLTGGEEFLYYSRGVIAMASDANVGAAADVQLKIAVHDEKFNTVMAKIDATNTRIDDFIGEIREQNKIRAAEIKALDAKIDGMSKHIQNIFYTTIGAIAAMVITVLINLARG